MAYWEQYVQWHGHSLQRKRANKKKASALKVADDAKKTQSLEKCTAFAERPVWVIMVFDKRVETKKPFIAYESCISNRNTKISSKITPHGT